MPTDNIIHSFIHLLLRHQGSIVRKTTTKITIETKAKKKRQKKNSTWGIVHKNTTVRVEDHVITATYILKL